MHAHPNAAARSLRQPHQLLPPTQIPSDDPGERDSKDEVLVASDLNVITDEDLKHIFSALPPDSRLFMTADCCHSGTLLDHPEVQVRARGNSWARFERAVQFLLGGWRGFSVCAQRLHTGICSACSGTAPHHWFHAALTLALYTTVTLALGAGGALPAV
jgi:hypothetical protein